MDFIVTPKTFGETEGALFLPFFEKQLQVPASLSKEDKSLLQQAFQKFSFTGTKDQAFIQLLPSGKTAVAVGLGPKESFHWNKLRLALATAVSLAQKLQLTSIACETVLSGHSQKEVVHSITETAVMATYTYEQKQQKKPQTLTKVVFVGVPKTNEGTVKKALEEGKVYGELNAAARTLVNTPASTATPHYVAEVAKKIAKEHGIRCTVLGKKELAKKEMNAILAVGGGSDNEPCLVVLEYQGTKNPALRHPLALVGKGVCFDSGGLSLKPALGMETMKMDKGGAAVVLYTMAACARLKVPLNVVGIMPLVENLPSGTSYKPGDIIQTMSKKTIEVLNTDAEGRVILADALHYATQFEPFAIIDLATLTGACIIALGNVTGLMTNSPEIAGVLERAGEKTFERVWRLPIYEEYFDLIKSDIADVKNIVTNMGPSPAGAVTAAKFLEQFVGKTPWAHLDIAGSAWAEEPNGYYSKGATGAGVRLITQFILDWVGKK